MINFFRKDNSRLIDSFRKDLDAVSEKVLDYCNLMGGLHADSLPEMAFVSRLGTRHAIYPEWLPETHRSRVIHYYAGYVYTLKKAFINADKVNKDNSRHDIARSACHEHIHHIRNINRLSERSHALPIDSDDQKRLFLFDAFEESGAMFVGETITLGNNRSVEDVIRAVYTYKKGARIAFETLQETYALVGNAGKISSDNRFREKLFDVIGFYGMDKRVKPKEDFHFAGLNFAVLVYASNGFDIEKTAKKLITYEYEGIMQELRDAVRPSVREAVIEISRVSLEKRRAS